MRTYRPVLSLEAKRWRAGAAQGVSLCAMAKADGRDERTVRYHVDHRPFGRLRAKAVRLEGLFAACNRALAGELR